MTDQYPKYQLPSGNWTEDKDRADRLWAKSGHPDRVTTALASPARCVQCGKTGPGEMFEPFNPAGNLACKGTLACQLRQDGEDPVALLSALLRSVRLELGATDTARLIGLLIDLEGYRGAVTDELDLPMQHTGWRQDYYAAKAAREAGTKAAKP